MDELTFVEVLARGGDVLHRIPISGFPVTVGRAYDNDVILDDPYVAPHHLRIDLEADGSLRAVDRGSRNGLYVGHSKKAVKETRLEPNDRIQIGHTRLRVRPKSYAVPAERPQIHWPWLLDYRVLIVAALALVALELVEAYAAEHERFDTVKMVFPPLMFAAGGFVWAALWALFGKILTGRANFVGHASIAMVGLLAMEFADVFGGHLAFALSMSAIEPASVLATAVIFATMLYAHLCLVSRYAPRYLATAAGGVAALLLASAWAFSYMQQSNDLGSMPYLTQLKAPIFRMVPAKSPDDFLARAQGLKGELKTLLRD